MSSKIAFIIVPHPDDLEILVGHTTQYLIKHGFQVIEILMSWGEYGIVNRFEKTGEHLKGIPLRTIRIKENSNAKNCYGRFPEGKPKVSTIPMMYIDGFVPFNTKSIDRLYQLFIQYKPQIILGPDPIYALDYHVDHLATGRIVYGAVKKYIVSHELNPKVKYGLYQTFRPNFGCPLQSWDVLEHAFVAHRSQMTPFLTHILLGALKTLIFPWRCNRFKLRMIDQDSLIRTGFKEKNKTLFDKIMYCLLHSTANNEDLYRPLPAELGLEIDPKF